MSIAILIAFVAYHQSLVCNCFCSGPQGDLEEPCGRGQGRWAPQGFRVVPAPVLLHFFHISPPLLFAMPLRPLAPLRHLASAHGELPWAELPPPVKILEGVQCRCICATKKPLTRSARVHRYRGFRFAPYADVDLADADVNVLRASTFRARAPSS